MFLMKQHSMPVQSTRSLRGGFLGADDVNRDELVFNDGFENQPSGG